MSRTAEESATTKFKCSPILTIYNKYTESQRVCTTYNHDTHDDVKCRVVQGVLLVV